MNRKYNINEKFFNKINTEEKAYFLGFLYADGYINDKQKVVVLNLAEQDVEILYKLNKIINSNRPLQFINMVSNRKLGIKAQDQFRLNINCKKIYNDLLSLGCEPRKTFILKFPTLKQVPKHLINHFIRGYFDGDGSLTGYFPSRGNGKHFQCGLNIISTYEFIDELRKIISHKLKINTILSKRFKDKKNNYTFILSGNLNILKFLEFIYEDSNIFLKRKYDKMLTILKIIDSRKNHKSRVYLNKSKFLSSLISK